MKERKTCCLAGILFALGGCADDVDQPREVGETQRAGTPIAFPDAEGTPGHGLFFIGESVEDIQYSVREGYAVHQGDIILGRVDEFAPHELGQEDTAASAVYPDRLWKHAVVPVAFSSDLSDEVKREAQDAIEAWEAASAVRFIARKDRHQDYVEVVEGDGCFSDIGKRGRFFGIGSGKQELSLVKNGGCAIHEFGHALGLWHEQSRSDRDNHVTVHWDNVHPDQRFNFETYSEQGFSGRDVGAYDLESIMHYGSFVFPRDGLAADQPTLTRKDGGLINANFIQVSDGDARGIADLYGFNSPPNGCVAILRPGQGLGTGDAVSSCDGSLVLIMQDDGNLVLYNAAEALWASGTAGSGATRAIMQFDGNLVVYDGSSDAKWSTGTHDHPDAFLKLFADGRMFIAAPNGERLWER